MSDTTSNMVDEIDLTAADHRRSSVEIRNEIRKAIRTTANSHDGFVHIADIRNIAPPWATGPQVGAVICHLVRAGTLAHTGRYRPNGNTRTRNRTRPAEVYRLVRPLPEEH